MKRRLQRLSPFISIVLFAVALWALHHGLRNYHYKDLLRDLKAIPPLRIAVAVFFTAISYFMLTGYDVLAFRYIRHPLPYRHVAFASLIGYAFSNNVGQALISGGSVRFRLYASWSLSAIDIAKVVVFNTLTYWLGFIALGGLCFVLKPFPAPESLRLPEASIPVLGWFFLAGIALYILFCFALRRTLRFRGWEFTLPTGPMSLTQVIVSSVDLVFSGAVLYALLPSASGVHFVLFLGIYLLAQIAGLISSVPGGLGVFETVMIGFIPPEVPRESIFGGLVVYRVIYYLAPLALATALLGVHEVMEGRRGLARFAHRFGAWIPESAPQLLAFAAFLSGAVLLASAATPSIGRRLGQLEGTIPLEVVEISYALAGLAGAGLILLCHGLLRRLDAAYVGTLILMAGGAVFSLLKGLEYEAAGIVAAAFAVTLPARPHFYRRRPPLRSERLPAAWLAGTGLALAGFVWLGFFSYRHVDYTPALWTTFAFDEEAGRALRTMAAVIVLTLAMTVASLLRPAPPAPIAPVPAELDRVAPIAAASPDPLVHLALLGDKNLLIGDSGRSLLMYASRGRSWIALGDPAGPEEEARELAWRFVELAEDRDRIPVFHEIRAPRPHLYIDLGLSLLKAGEEARKRLAGFEMETGVHPDLREAREGLRRDGFTVEVLPPGAAPETLARLAAIDAAWADRAGAAGGGGFSPGSFREDYVRRLPVAVAGRAGVPVAFALLQAAGASEMAADFLRHHPAKAPAAVMDFLLLELMLHARDRGFEWFNLGGAAPSGAEAAEIEPLLRNAGPLAFRHGEHFRDPPALRRYKEKFRPDWSPRWLASPGGMALPAVLGDLAMLIRGEGNGGAEAVRSRWKGAAA